MPRNALRTFSEAARGLSDDRSRFWPSSQLTRPAIEAARTVARYFCHEASNLDEHQPLFRYNALRTTPVAGVVRYEEFVVADLVDLALQSSLVIRMERGAYRCCRCELPLRVGKLRQPWPCRDGCGEWLTREAVDEHLFPEFLRPIESVPRNALRCIFCGVTMRAPLAELYHLCLKHGIWFDKNDRDLLARVLRSEIARHREVRRANSLVGRIARRLTFWSVHRDCGGAPDRKVQR